LLEARNLLATSTFALTTPSQVSGDSPLAAPPPSPPSPPSLFSYNSEVEPQIAVDPTHPSYAVAIWQQDRFLKVGGARALVVSVTTDADLQTGAIWSPPTPIPWFNATDPAGAAFPRYTDPWVSIAPNGDVYASAVALTPFGPVPDDTAVMVIKGKITITNNGPSISWDPAGPTTLIHTTAPPGIDPVDLANDKEMVVTDPNDRTGQTAYVVWDQLDFPSNQANLNAIHAGAAIRENAFFSKTTDGGAHWSTAQNITNFQKLNSAFGNQLIVEPDGTLVDVCTLFNGSGNQAPQAGQVTVAVIQSTDGGTTWSAPIAGPAIESVDPNDPDTGAPVRAGEPLISVAVDPNNGNIYAVWSDGRFSGFAHADAAFSMSTDGGLTWSAPIKVNQTPTNIPAGDQQAFTPNVAVNSDGTVAVTYYDFRNNTADPKLLTDFWLVHASSNFTSASSWTSDEKRLTDASFDMEKAVPTNRGYFLGDYQGLVAAGQNFYALFAQAGSTSDPSDIWFRDPPPAGESPAASAAPAAATPSSAPSGSRKLAVDALAALGIGLFGENTPSSGGTGPARTVERSSVVNQPPLAKDDPGSLVVPPAESADFGWSGGGGDTDVAGGSEALPEAISSDGGDGSSSD
jgi:hypothetical protein